MNTEEQTEKLEMLVSLIDNDSILYILDWNRGNETYELDEVEFVFDTDGDLCIHTIKRASMLVFPLYLNRETDRVQYFKLEEWGVLKGYTINRGVLNSMLMEQLKLREI